MKTVGGLLFGSLALAFSGRAEILENDAMRLCFRDDCGMGLTGIVNKVEGEVCFAADTDADDFWRLLFAKSGEFGPDGVYSLVAVSNRSPARRQYVEKRGDVATFVFEGIDLPDVSGGLDVRARVELLPGAGESRWTLDIVNRSQTYALYKTCYPYLRKLGRPGEADALVPSQNLGAMMVRGRGRADSPDGGKTRGYSYMGYYPMVTAFMQDGAGVYVAAHDPDGRIKDICMDDWNSVWFSTHVENSGVPGRAASGPKYPVVVDVFRGDWWQAARKYRAWALRQRWAEKGRIVDRHDYPRAMCETSLWLNIYDGAETALNVLTAARKRFPDFDVGLHWHKWNRWGHDSHYPEYFPTVTNVAQTMPLLNELGQKAMIYTNGRLWDADISSWEIAKPFAAAKPDGRPYIERYLNKRAQGVMCPYTGFWQDTMLGLAERIVGELQAPGLFMDQIGAAGPARCWNPHHGHALGGGVYWFEGYQKLLCKAHAITSSFGAFLTTEGTSETWMNNVDGFLCVTFLTDKDVPFYPAVYSGYTTYFCSPQSFSDASDAFWAFQSRQVLWGVAPGWFEPAYVLADGKAKVEAKRDMIGRLCRFRQKNIDCFAYGELLDELRMVENPGIVRFVLNPRWAEKKPQEATMPAVIGSLWRSCDGRRVVFAANLTNSERVVTVANEGFAGVRLRLAPYSFGQAHASATENLSGLDGCR